MGAPLKAIVLTVPAVLAVTVLALQHADARRYYGYIYRAYHARYHDVTGAIPRAAQQPAIIVDTGPGPLKIPNAALEPARWSDLDGWSGDDHASAYATLSASCRSIVRSAAFRAEQSHAHDARAAARRMLPRRRRRRRRRPAIRGRCARRWSRSARGRSRRGH